MKLTGIGATFDLDPLSTSTVKNHQIGTIAFDALGNKYRYAKAGAVALVAGNLLQAPARSTDFTDMAVQAAAAIGATQILVTLGATSTTANLFDEGTVAVTSSTGIGQTFKVQSHSVSSNATTATFNLYEPLNVALTTSSKVTIRQNLFSGVIVSPTTRTGKTVGVALAAIPIAGFGWIGTVGHFGVLSDSTVAAVGEGLSPSTSTAGCVTKAVTLLERIGTADVLCISAKDEPVWLNCED